MLENPLNALLCRICGKSVPVETAKADRDGKAITGSVTPHKVNLEKSSNDGYEKSARMWPVAAQEVSHEQDPRRLRELITELNQARWTSKRLLEHRK